MQNLNKYFFKSTNESKSKRTERESIPAYFEGEVTGKGQDVRVDGAAVVVGGDGGEAVHSLLS